MRIRPYIKGCRTAGVVFKTDGKGVRLSFAKFLCVHQGLIQVQYKQLLL